MALVYSCCFWFSLRLGGILIGLFSFMQALAVLILSCIAHGRLDEVKEVLSHWVHDMHLVYVQSFFESVLADPGKYITIIIMFTCIYILLCVLYIYGAFMCNNTLMVGWILSELLRLLAVVLFAVTWLVLVKENSMDIGLLIGASVGCGFTLLGMFYLWVCAANLPVLINEMKHDEQAATIAKLQQLLAGNPSTRYTRDMDDFHTTLEGGQMFYIR